VRVVAAAGVVALTVGVSALAASGSAPSAAGQGAATTVSIYETTLLERDQKTIEVSTEELRGILAAKSAYVFDARPTMEYAVSHIPGALNVAQQPGTPTSLYISDVAEIERLVPAKDAALVLYCNGPFCGKSKRLSEELLEAGYTNVRRYQLGAPVWRALVGAMEIELEGIRYVLAGDRTAVVFDVRSAEEFAAGSIAGARHLPPADVTKAKDDGRLPMEDHNTRIIVLGRDGEQARAVAEEIARNAFHNVMYFNGSIDSVLAMVQ
jgi:rhodanese-related sulfurtransferase